MRICMDTNIYRIACCADLLTYTTIALPVQFARGALDASLSSLRDASSALSERGRGRSG